MRAAPLTMQDVLRVADGDPETPPTTRRRHSELGQLFPSTLENRLLGSGQGSSVINTGYSMW